MTPTAPAVQLNQDHMIYTRNASTRTELDLADLAEVDVFARGEQCYWHLTGKDRREALVPVGIPGESLIRQYLADWRGFDYDGLVRFVSEPPVEGRRRLWPLG
ncbi:hypothetical protein [Saccharospirillum salsuginis]|uniref:hypothetical protein n=1 Tax=Saccharospirillum salsuginis TaxID=418750 RepID=UPI00167B7888|nr:hypothetical protein [Saccharospirillum salsuginis]